VQCSDPSSDLSWRSIRLELLSKAATPATCGSPWRWERHAVPEPLFGISLQTLDCQRLEQQYRLGCWFHPTLRLRSWLHNAHNNTIASRCSIIKETHCFQLSLMGTSIVSRGLIGCILCDGLPRTHDDMSSTFVAFASGRHYAAATKLPFVPKTRATNISTGLRHHNANGGIESCASSCRQRQFRGHLHLGSVIIDGKATVKLC
jgi:hypothetical protein